MQKKEWYALVLVILIVLLIVIWKLNAPKQPSPAFACTYDNECFPASCCHAKACVSLAEKPSCKGIYCTQLCEPGTLDCGQARCGCIQGQCQVVPE